MRITYTRDHFQRSYIIQIVLDDDQIEGLPISINLEPNIFIKLSAQLKLLATVAEALESAPTEEDNNMADLTQDEQDDVEEELEQDVEEEDTGEPEEEPELEEEDEVLEELEEEDLEEEEELQDEEEDEED